MSEIKDTEKRYILCSAIHFDDGKKHDYQPKNISSGFVLCGRRHHNILASLKIMGYPRLHGHKMVQGFLTNDNGFFDRKTSYELAKAIGQILNSDSELSSQLISEDLWRG